MYRKGNIMKRLRPNHLVPLAVGALLAGFGTAAQAQVFFGSNLTHDQETPPAGTTPLTTSTGAPRPLSFGTGSLVLNAAQTQLTFTVTVFNIDFTGSQTPDNFDNLTAAHIHGGPNVTPATTAGVVFGFIGTPFNDTNPTDTIVTPFVGQVGGTVTSKWDAPEGNNTTLAAQINNLLTGRTYFNFHTVQFPGGEIRGAIVAAPEPGTLALLALTGVPAAGMILRRRRR
jgi:hypothetical protein